MTVQLSKIQLRRGTASDLPGAPITLTPLVFSAGLDDGELGFATDTGRLFVGQISPTNGFVNYQRTTFPYQNVEVLTENTPAAVYQTMTADNQAGYFSSVPLTITASYRTLQTFDVNSVAHDFHMEVAGNVNAVVYYFVFGSNGKATRQGVLNIVWNSAMVGSPVCTDTSVVAVGSTPNLQWTATVVSGSHVVMQYINQTGDTPTVFFRIDRPTIG